jgi:hypothetical protein
MSRLSNSALRLIAPARTPSPAMMAATSCVQSHADAARRSRFEIVDDHHFKLHFKPARVCGVGRRFRARGGGRRLDSLPHAAATLAAIFLRWRVSDIRRAVPFARALLMSSD